MTCIVDHYNYAIITITSWIMVGINGLTPLIGRPLAMVAVAILMSPLALLLVYVWMVPIPKFIKWYYEETIDHKARMYWRHKCVGTGMTVMGAKISIGLGVVFFFLVRFVVSLPSYYEHSLPAFAIAFCGVAIVGFCVGGNVPGNRAARYKYFRLFHEPTVTGVGLGLASMMLEFLFQAASVALHAA